ncbi:ABC transporter substrate-binding protein [Mycetocola sp.]|uniref:ABC transporter substrate-binding protein n=1 Tax=Mycetocola sp. TaxID=1871042 RepID=UPI0039897F54
MSLRRTATVALALTAGLSLSACSSGTPAAAGSSSDEPVSITFASYNLGTEGAAGEGTQELIDLFMEKNPHITVEGRAIPNAEILTRTRTDVAAGNGPDVVQMGYSKVREALTTLPMQSIEEAAGEEWAEATEGLPQGILNTGDWEGSNHGVPYTVSTPTLFYNATLFEELGLDAENPPETLAEIREAAEVLVDAGHHGVHFGLVSESKADFVAQSVLNSVGGSLTVDDGEDIGIDSDEAKEGFTLLQDLVTDGLMPAVKAEDAMAAFTQGDLGMFINTTAYSSSLVKASESAGWEVRTAGFPELIDGMAPKPTHSGAALMMLSTETAEQQAAWEFIEFMTSPEAYMIITEKIGYLPLRADMVDDPEWLGGYFAENQMLVPALEQLKDVAPYQFFPGERSNQATVTYHDEAVDPILVQGADVDSSLDDVAEKIRAELP